MTLDASENTWPAPWHSFKPPHKIKPKKGVKIDRSPTRRDDERLLAWLAAREADVPVKVIASQWGVSTNTVIGAVYRIRKEIGDE